MTALVEVKDVVKQYGGLRALDGVSLRVQPGEFLSIIGPNGAGKSTLFNVITGVAQPTSGMVAIDDEPVRRFRPDLLQARGLGRTFQVARPVASLTVRQNVMLGAGGRVFAASSRRSGRDPMTARSTVASMSCSASLGWPKWLRAWRVKSPLETCAGWRSPERWRASHAPS